MTLNMIFTRLCEIDRRVQALITDTGFDYENGFGPQVCLDPGNQDDRFFRDCLELCMSSFEVLHQDLWGIRDYKSPGCVLFECKPVPLTGLNPGKGVAS